MTRTHFTEELEAVHKNLIDMGETTITLFAEAMQAVVDPNPEASARASELESQTDHEHRIIHDRCFNLITLQAPVARDARLLTGILDAIVDLELIADYAYEIVVLTASITRRPPSQITGQIVELGRKIGSLLSTAVDSWRTGDRAEALSVRPSEAPLRAECEVLYSKLAQLVSAAGEGTGYVDLMLVCKHMERILRHAVCLAEAGADAAPLSQAGA